MKLFDSLATIFINTFGITQPTEQQRRQASWFIVGLLVVALAAVATIGVVLSQVMHR